jgi:hypothetical protein
LAFHAHSISALVVPLSLRSAASVISPLTLNAAQILRELGPMLSSNASIYFPGSSEFANATERWSAFRGPSIRVVIEPGTDDDVAATVRGFRLLPSKTTSRMLNISSNAGQIC